jgi:hypothetical protein
MYGRCRSHTCTELSATNEQLATWYRCCTWPIGLISYYEHFPSMLNWLMVSQYQAVALVLNE